MSSAEPPPPGYEPRDAAPRAIAFTGAALAVGVAAVLAASVWIYRTHDRPAPSASRDSLAMSFQHGPAEQTSIARDWIAQDQSVRAHLATYGWIDRDAAVMRIPIERAMSLVAAEAAANTKPGTAP